MSNSLDYNVVATSLLNKTQKENVFSIYLLIQNNTEGKFLFGLEKNETDQHKVDIELTGSFSDNLKILTPKEVYLRGCSLNRQEKIKVIEPNSTEIVEVPIIISKFMPAGTYEFDICLLRNGKPLTAKNNQSIKIHVQPHYPNIPLPSLRKRGKLLGESENEAYTNFDKKALSDTDAVIMAVWKRIDNLDRTILNLIEQDSANPVLYLWVNNLDYKEKIKKKIKKYELPIKVLFSEYNIGGFGRFYAARQIAEHNDAVIFIDDDEILSSTYIKDLKNEITQNSMHGSYAHYFVESDNYWTKKQISAPGERATYLGTGGMIAPSSIFKNLSLYQCPDKYWFVEDLWLSWFAEIQLGMKLYKSSAELKIIDDQKNQFNILVDVKNEFLKYLTSKGLVVGRRN